MNNIISLCVITLCIASLVGCNSLESESFEYQRATKQMTQAGEVEGTLLTDSNTLAWLGVPYAAAPIGELRWKAPITPTPWKNTLNTTRFSDATIQLGRDGLQGSEDSLYLNIWRPNTAAKNLPVMVFVHGGGNRTGKSQSFVGDKLAVATNSIVISINYRLGATGWFRHSSLRTGDPATDSGNFALLDIIQSLTWVEKNIASFGGDPEQVTAAGQSAGARDVLALMISPLAHGLFDQIIAFSGGMTLSSPSAGDEIAEQVITKLVVADGFATTAAEAKAWIENHADLASYLRSKPAAELLAHYGDSPIKMAPFPHLFTDGYVIPADGFKVLSTGAYKKVPVILGSDDMEFSVFAMTDPYFIGDVMSGKLFNNAKKLAQYQQAKSFGSQLYVGFNVENVAQLLVANHDQPPVYGYRFAWGSKPGVIKSPVADLLGTTHGFDMDFVTGHHTNFADKMFPNSLYFEENAQGRAEITHSMMAYLGNFLHSGNPNDENLPRWQAWNNKAGVDKILRIDGDLTKADISMSAEYYQKATVIAQMQQQLPAAEFELITSTLFSGRFFWECETSQCNTE